MNLSEAKARLKELANGKLVNLKVDINCFSNGQERTEYWVYTGNTRHFTGGSWEEAIKKLEDSLVPVCPHCGTPCPPEQMVGEVCGLCANELDESTKEIKGAI